MDPTTQKGPDRANGQGPEFPRHHQDQRPTEITTDALSDAIDAALARHRQFKEDVARARRWCTGRGLTLVRHSAFEEFQVADASGFILETYRPIDDVLRAIAARDGCR